MSSSPSLDRQSFESFLANAFAVQKSGLDAQSLSAVMEVQRFITTAEFSVDDALNLVVERTLGMSSASGVAIARLESNQLVYCSVSGSSGTEVGRRLPAVFSACAQSEGGAEILRVENAQTDSRIQAEICRQFGATSLLILPIYDKQVVVGVLQIHFGEAHSFVDREVRAYRLMAGMAGDAISRTLQYNREQARVIPGRSDIIQRNIPQEYVFSDNHKDSVQAARIASFLTGVFGPKALARHSNAVAKRRIQQVGRFFADHAWPAETTVAAVLLCMALGIAHYYHPRASTLALTLSTSSNTAVSSPTNPASASNHWKRFDHGLKDGLAPSAAFRRVRIGPNEVDYVAEDVTIKHFANSHPRLQIQSSVRQVNIGDDVTVRYFTNDSSFVSQTESGSPPTQTTRQSLPRSQ